MQFSKRVLLMQYGVSALLALAVIIGTLIGRDVTAVAALAGSSVLADGTISGLYLWKSKCENRAKYAQAFVAKFAEKYGFDNALKITEFVLRD